MKKKVIFVEWSTKGRDFEIVLPLMYFFENYIKWDVEYISIFNLYEILKKKPDIIIMSNTIGAHVNIEFSKLARRSNYKLFSHVSEGLFRESNIKHMVYGGVNELYEIHTTYWSKKSYELAIKYFPEIKNKAFSTGSLSHDKYKIYSKINHLNTTKYKKVISYMSFDFHNVMQNRKQFENRLGKDIVDSQEQHIKLINKVLKNIILNNKDILFLLKPHPGDGNKVSMEFDEIINLENVKLTYNESIVDVINASDIILNFQSSTNLESWLYNKVAITIFNNKKFEELYAVTKGSINVSNSIQLQEYIDEFYKSGKIKAFEEKKTIREQIILDYIGFSDGMNHIRFMSFLKSYIEQIEKGEMKKSKWDISLKHRLKAYIKHMIYTISKGKYNTPYIKKWAHIYDIFNEKEVEEQKKLRYPDFDIFYRKNKEIIDKIYSSWHKNWK